MTELTLDVPGQTGPIPLLLVHAGNPGRFAGCVLVYHGLGASKEVQRQELHLLAGCGFLAVGVDAPGHGARARDRSAAGGRVPILRWVHQAVEEVPHVVDVLSGLLGEASGRFGLVGISMGGYVAYGAAVREPRLAAIVPILGSPDWPGSLPAESDERTLLAVSPHLSPQAFAPRALLALNAGRDVNVPPAGSRDFVSALAPFYARFPERLAYVEYPESGHFMREEDWHDLWRRTMDWLMRHLGRTCTAQAVRGESG